MKKVLWLVILFLLLFPASSYSQKQGQEKIDSLVQVLKSATDTGKVNVLNLLAIEFRNTNPDTSIYFAKQALELSRQLQFEFGIANSFQAMARAKANLGEVDEALKLCDEAMVIYDQLKVDAENDNLSKIKSQVSATSNMKGIAFMMKGNYPEALKHLLSALKIREELGDELGISYTENNLGIVYFNQKNFEESLKHYFVSLKIREKFGDKAAASVSYGNIGVIYFDLGRYDEAKTSYLKSLQLATDADARDAIASALDNIGQVYKKKGNSEEALIYHQKALNIYKELGNLASQSMVYGNISENYLTGGQLKLAELYIDSSMKIALDMNLIDQLKSNYLVLTNLDSTKHDFAGAFEKYKKYIFYRDSLINEGTIKKITEQEMQYSFDKKEAITKAEQEKIDIRNKNIRNTITLGLAGSLLFLVIVSRQRNKIKAGKKRSDELLLNILPEEVAEELKQKGTTEAKQFDEVTVMFTDFKGFTQIAEKLSPSELVAEIDTCFKAFDEIIAKYNIEKIKTIGDSYMCAGGLPVVSATHAKDVVKAALEIQNYMNQHSAERIKNNQEVFEIRIGIHTGPVVAGVVGLKKFAYDIWGDTVNIASRMESSGEAGKVNVSGTTYEKVKDDFKFEYRGKVSAKNKGEIEMYFVIS